MKNEFALAFNEVLEDKGLPRDVVMGALEAAMVSAYRRSVNASNAQHVEAKVDSETGQVAIYAEKEVVEDVQDERTEVLLAEAQKVDPEAQLGDMVVVESTPEDFGRVAAQTARQVIQQRIREAERDAQYNYYIKQVGEIVSGVVQAINPLGVTLGLEMKAEGIMPRNQQIPREHFRVHDRTRALLLEIKTTNRGPQIILSRAHRDFLRRLLENEVPEIYHGMVEIRSVSREPGQRSKLAVAALQPGVDPVGACVGIRGVRIQAIVRELNDEKIDVIEWSSDPAVYIAKALSPARVSGVYLDESAQGPKTATVVVPEDQLSLAIGRDGQNARLAAKLTGWRIDIKSLPEATSDVLFKLSNNPEYRILKAQEADIIPQAELILGKKAEGRPVTPEEYHLLASFVDRVERTVIEKRKAIRREYEQRLKAAEEAVPQDAYELPILTLGLSEEINAALAEAEYGNVGELMLQMLMNRKEIEQIEGLDAAATDQIQAALDLLTAAQKAARVEAETKAAAEAKAEMEAAVEAGIEAPSESKADLKAEAQAEAEAITPEIEASQATELVETEAVAAEVEPVSEAVETSPTLVEEEEEEPASLEELFKLKPDMLVKPVEDLDAEEEEEDDETGSAKKQDKKKKAGKKKYVEVEYDPDHDVTLVRRRRKRGQDDWGEWEA
ncbi:MAG: transcription termination/antitermination protein NusA [Anaerolineales bacterium]|nr:transcription termination/antitermination protein NusA [Anaerolineales bacterium]